jgi:uncharacterized membrane protein YraQ (UPF0718 family)
MEGVLIMADKKKRSSVTAWWFIAGVAILYMVSSVIDSPRTGQALIKSSLLIFKIVPVLLMVIIFMTIINYFFRPQKVKRLLGKESGITGWIISLIGGVLSHGSIIIWYPLLKELQGQGVRPGLIAVFLYSRAIKLPLLPLLIYYFGWSFSIVFLFYILIGALIQGWLVDRLVQKIKNT